jgi:hypothetical protein
MYELPNNEPKRYYNRHIASLLNKAGVGAIAGCFAPPGIARSDEIDLSFTRQHGTMEIIAREEAFGFNPESFPSQYVKLFKENEFISKHPRPVAFILVSKPTDGILVLPMSTVSKWDTWISSEKQERYLIANKRLLKPFAEFVNWAKARERKWQRQIAKMY